MRRLALLALALAGCNQWVRPHPPVAMDREWTRQRDSVALVQVECSWFEDDPEVSKFGSGVIVSNWQVLTARHVVDCPEFPTIHVSTDRGSWMFVVEEEWIDQDVVRIQMASLDSFPGTVFPPTVANPPPPGETVTLWAGSPEWVPQELIVKPDYIPGFMVSEGPTTKGNSGGGLYDDAGALVGIHTEQWVDRNGYSGSVASRILPGMVPR